MALSVPLPHTTGRTERAERVATAGRRAYQPARPRDAVPATEIARRAVPASGWSIEVVAIESVLLHEEHDLARAAALTGVIAADGMQRHPAVLARVDGGRLVHLDGANRITALAQLGCRHVAAQVVDYGDPETVVLDTWLQLVNLDLSVLLDAAAAPTGCRIEQLDPAAALAALEARAAAALVRSDGSAFALCGIRDLATRITALRQLTSVYRGSTLREVLPEHDVLGGVEQLLARTPAANTAVVVAPFSKRDVIDLASRTGTLLPAGITRHVIACGRALGVNAPLSLLQAALSADEKTAQLRELLAGRRIRRYVEPTIVYESY